MTRPLFGIADHEVSLLPLEEVPVHVRKLGLLERSVEVVRCWRHLVSCWLLFPRLVNHRHLRFCVDPLVVFVIQLPCRLYLCHVLYLFQVACSWRCAAVLANDALLFVQPLPLGLVGRRGWEVLLLPLILQLLRKGVPRGALMYYVLILFEALDNVVGSWSRYLFLDPHHFVKIVVRLRMLVYPERHRLVDIVVPQLHFVALDTGLELLL